MKYALIDLGSNSIRLCIYNWENGELSKVLSQKELAGLAGYVRDGVLDMEGISRACEVLAQFSDIALRFVERENLRVFATASLRNIKNRQEAGRIIAERTGIFPQVLEGEEEAALAYAGAMRYAPQDDGILIDIGGGSTELVLFRNSRPVGLTSLPIGCLNLYTQYVAGPVPDKQERKAMKQVVRRAMSGLDWVFEQNYPLIVGVGGTVRATLKIARAVFHLPMETETVETEQIKELLRMLGRSRHDIFHAIYRVAPERMLTITSGLIILREATRRFNSDQIQVSQFGVREGYLLEHMLR